ncbi:hypothetical protein A5624_10465 [Mycobacterium sp. 1482292.6]|uniref:SDR family oxidoreductase n=1 Tax=unclassified Mycobacterium TaxID=2642494 RepID=UPI0007FCD4F9|nr:MULTISPECIES: SDR family oxidoreductase [unclassified Mycobacterium]OBJ12669.1 hypothetical protein A5624_10465 [Mycobacterium sp. 1482292.6]OBJ22727.1 hypothetical protein A5622_14710 [Mycobacterium sp. 1245801.1]
MTRTALVTGANGGIGSAVCERLRGEGFVVRTMDLTGPADVVMNLSTEPVPPEAAADIDICVSVAAVVGTFASAHTMSSAEWSSDIDVNLTGAFRVIQACLTGMRERRFGRIVAISSLAAQLGTIGKVAYSASKAGLHGMIRTIAIENCSFGITTNCVLPGVTATPPVLALPQGDQDRIRAAIPSGRFGRPEEVADLVAFLVREESGYITAQDIGIDGGLALNGLYVGPTQEVK